MTEFKNLTVEIVDEDRDVSDGFKGARKHWMLEVVNNDTQLSELFDYYGGSLVTLDEDDLLDTLMDLLSDAEVVIEGESTAYIDSIEYLIKEFGYEYRDAVDVSRGCKVVYNKLCNLIDDLDDTLYDWMNELSDVIDGVER